MTELNKEEMWIALDIHTTEVSDIKLPCYAYKKTKPALERAISNGINLGYVYRISVFGAEIKPISNICILNAGEIEIKEILTIQRIEGKPEIIERTNID
jgi:hypothetical protein